MIKSNPVEEITRLKASPGGDILMAGCGRLVNLLMQHELFDELRLMVYPVILGKAKRLFQDGLERLALRQDEAKPVGAGVLILVYQAERKR